MPTRPRRICPRCRQAYAGQRCPTCTDRAAARAPSSWRYNDTAWKANRREYLRHHPTCCLCGKPSQVPDHHPVSRRDLLRQGVTDPDAWHRLRPLCQPCHRTETARNQPGGWNVIRD